MMKFTQAWSLQKGGSIIKKSGQLNEILLQLQNPP